MYTFVKDLYQPFFFVFYWLFDCIRRCVRMFKFFHLERYLSRFGCLHRLLNIEVSWSSSRAACTDSPPLSLSLSLSVPLLTIAPGRSSRLHPVSAQSWCKWVLPGRLTLPRPFVAILARKSLRNLSLLLWQCPTYLIRLSWMVFEMGAEWPYSYCFAGCCFQYLFKTVQSSLCSSHLALVLCIL